MTLFRCFQDGKEDVLCKNEPKIMWIWDIRWNIPLLKNYFRKIPDGW